MLNIADPYRTFLRFGENGGRSRIRSVVTFQVRIPEFEIAHSGSSDTDKGWSVDSLFSARTTLETGSDHRIGLYGIDGQHGSGPPPASAHSDNPDPDVRTWPELADLMNFHFGIFPSCCVFV